MTTERNIVIHQGQAFALSLDYAGTAGRGQRMHIRLADSTATVVQILTHNGDANARVIFDTDALDITIGASVSAGWVVLADRVEWVYDIEDYDLADEDDCVIPYRGKVIVRGNRTRASDVTPSDPMPSGDGRYVRFDGAQGLSNGQMTQARENIDFAESVRDLVGTTLVAGSNITITVNDAGDTITIEASGGGGGVTDHGALTGLADDDHTQYALADGTRGTFEAAGAVSTHAALTTGVHGLGGASQLNVGTTAGTVAAGDHAHTGTYQPLATVLTNTTAAFTTAQETKLSGIEAAADVTDAGNVGTAIDGATAKTTPVDADTVALIDSDASNTLKKLSWANIKATAKAYFDTLYQAASATLTTWAGITPAAGVGTFIATPSSANLAAAVTDETGSGALVFATSPTLVTPALGTPSSGNLANCTFPAISGITGFTAAESTSSPNATVPVASLTANNAATNVDAALCPKGAGAVLAEVPDGASTGGNKRGVNAVDLQTSRTSATHVASGAISTIGGGANNTASGSRGTVSGGDGNAASGTYATASGGLGNNASGQSAAIAGGSDNTAGGTNSWVSGGSRSTTRGISGAGAYSAGLRAATGDRQTMVLPIACAARTDATATVMTSDAGAASATNQMVLPNNSSMFFEVDVVAHDSALKSASWKVQGTIRRGANAAATAIVGTNVTTTFGSDLSGGSPGVTCTADTTSGALAVTFTGIAATTIYPSGHIRTVIAA